MQHFARRAAALRFHFSYHSRRAFSANHLIAPCASRITPSRVANQRLEFCSDASASAAATRDVRVEEKKTIEVLPLPEGISGDSFQLLDMGGTEVDGGPATVLAVHGPPSFWSRQKEPLYGASGGIFAVIEAGGTQHKVCADNALYLNRIPGEVNTQVVFDKVLLLGTVAWTAFGRPYIGGARVTATIEEQTLSGKVMVTKFKKRKGYTRRKGHRQNVTRVRINEVQFEFPSSEHFTPHEIEYNPLRPPSPKSPRWFE